MAGFFNNDDDDFDIVEGRDDREGAQENAPAPAARPQNPAARPAARPAAQRPAAQPVPRGAQPAARPATSVPPRPTVAPPSIPVQNRAPAPALPRRTAAEPTVSPRPAAPRRVVPAPQPAPEPVEESYEDYDEDLLIEQDYEPPLEVVRQQEPIYAPRAEAYRVQATPAPSAQEDALFAPAAPAAPAPSSPEPRAKPKVKAAGGWGAILGLGAEKSKADSAAKPRSRWAGGRRGSLIIRVILLVVIAVLVFNGLQRIIAPNTGPTYDQVQDAARAAVGDTGFPTQQGAATAVGFATAFFNYDPAPAAVDLRNAKLAQFVNADGIDDLGAAYSDSASGQKVIDGPYLVSLTASSASSAVATVSLTLSGAPTDSGEPTTKLIYVSFPLTYQASSRSMSVSGSPTFVPPANVGGLDAANLEARWEKDEDVSSSIEQTLLPQFFTAWAASNAADLSNLLAGTSATTAQAKEGLHGAVTYVENSVGSTSVEQAGVGPSTQNHRRFQTTVSWLNPITDAQYTQVYRGWIVRQPSGSWTMEDIQNAAELTSAESDAEQQ